MRSSRQKSVPMNIWPGFVDVLATLLIVIIFLLMIFLLSQIFLNDALVGRDKALEQLNNRLANLTEQLSLVQSNKSQLEQELKQLNSNYQASLLENKQLENKLSISNDRIGTLTTQQQQNNSELAQLTQDLSQLQALKNKLEQDLLNANAEILAFKNNETRLKNKQAEIASQNNNLTSLSEQQRKELLAAQAQLASMENAANALQQQIAELNRLLALSQERDKKAKIQIVELGKKLNSALASKVQQLARYRSNFFGKLRDILGNRANVKIVGDRFVFQSEILFDRGSDILASAGQAQIKTLASNLLQLAKDIPNDIDWVLRIDGHTDKRPINTQRFPSNWELSTARAIAVTKFLITQGLPANRLAPTGFGEFQPLDNGDDDNALKRNRRIEFKLTTR